MVIFYCPFVCSAFFHVVFFDPARVLIMASWLRERWWADLSVHWRRAWAAVVHQYGFEGAGSGMLTSELFLISPKSPTFGWNTWLCSFSPISFVIWIDLVLIFRLKIARMRMKHTGHNHLCSKVLRLAAPVVFLGLERGTTVVWSSTQLHNQDVKCFHSDNRLNYNTIIIWHHKTGHD